MKHILIDFGRIEFFGLDIPIRLYGYGLMLILGFVLSIFIARRRAKRMGESVEVLYNIGIIALIGGVVGARLGWVIENWSSVSKADNVLGAIFNISSGGLIYFGGLLLGSVVVFAFMVIKRLPVRRYIDIVAVSLMIGLAFGRLGCLTRGCCYGGQVEAGWFLSMEFPMYAEPLTKCDGRDDNPWPEGDRGPSPPYGHHMDKNLITPDEHLTLLASRGMLVHQEDLHGKLSGDQLIAFDLTEDEITANAVAIAGDDGVIDHDEWRIALAEGKYLAGSEHWHEWLSYDANQDSHLSVAEFTAFTARHNRDILKRFDRDRSLTLSSDERSAANKFLQADQIAIARASHSLPVKPAQLLGFANSIILAILLSLFFRLRRREGQVFAMLLILYPITRFVLESIRSDNPHNLAKFQLTHNQWSAIGLVAAGLVMYIVLQIVCKPSAGPCWNERIKLRR